MVSGGLGLFSTAPGHLQGRAQPPWLCSPPPAHSWFPGGPWEREGSWPPALASDQASGTKGQCRGVSVGGSCPAGCRLPPSGLGHVSTPVPWVTEVQVGQCFENICVNREGPLLIFCGLFCFGKKIKKY